MQIEHQGSAKLRPSGADSTTATSNSMSPRVSLALPVYNGERFIADSIRSILSQDHPDFELVITDNASTDTTADICREFAAADSRIRYFRNERNLGAGPNYNLGFHLSTGEYFKWCSSDDLLSPNFIGACLRVLETNPQVALAYGTTHSIDQDGNEIPLVGSTMPDTRDDDPAHRFRNIVNRVGTCYEIFGMFRRQQLSLSSLHRPYYGSDRALLVEMSLFGQFVQVPGVVFYNREHPKRSINIADKKMRALWHTVDARSARGLEHLTLLKHLIELAIRHRRTASLSKTLGAIFIWMMTPLQLSRYALEIVGVVMPSVRDPLRRFGWSLLNIRRSTEKTF
jgi:glycosyltransferase involved in cell wall biosynthesis